MKYTLISYRQTPHIYCTVVEADSPQEAVHKLEGQYAVKVVFVFDGECVPQYYQPPGEVAEGLPSM